MPVDIPACSVSSAVAVEVTESNYQRSQRSWNAQQWVHIDLTEGCSNGNVALRLSSGITSFIWHYVFHLALRLSSGITSFVWHYVFHLALRLSSGITSCMPTIKSRLPERIASPNAMHLQNCDASAAKFPLLLCLVHALICGSIVVEPAICAI
jgi:hypothetical protein